MYAALWRMIPGPLVLRVVIATVVIAAVVATLVLVVFPAVDAVLFPTAATTVGG